MNIYIYILVDKLYIITQKKELSQFTEEKKTTTARYANDIRNLPARATYLLKKERFKKKSAT